VAEDDDSPVARRQRVDGLIDGDHALFADKLPFWIERPIGYFPLDTPLFALDRLIKRVGMDLTSSQVIQTVVGDDFAKPGGEGISGIIMRQRFEGFDERFLDQIFGLCGVLDNAKSQFESKSLVSIQQLGKGSLISGERLLNQIVNAFFWPISFHILYV